MTEANNPLSRLRAAAAAREAAGLVRVLEPRDCGPDPLIDFASNDYLGLARHPEVMSAAAAAAHHWGTGATGSRLVTGSTTVHATLERALADFMRAEAALVFSCGYLANMATITALAAALSAPPPAPAARTPPPRTRRSGPSILIISDVLNHASLVDACRLTRARVEIVPHQDVDAVQRALTRRREPSALVVTESAFSVGGGLTGLAALHRVTHAHGALLVIDEAHALGVVGPGGRGAACQDGIAAEPDVVRTVSLSKALGAQGGAVLGAAEVIDTLVSTGRGFIFDTALAPPSTAAALQALRVLEREPDLPVRAQRIASQLAAAAAQLGLVASPPGAAVVKVMLGEPALALTARRIFADHGLRAGCFRPPSVPPGGSCLRLTGRATLTGDDVAAASLALEAVCDHVRAGSPVGRKGP
jgi:8-amino-7-oxononanoate synthase